MYNERPFWAKPSFIGGAVIAFIILILIIGSFGTIGAGERGIKTTFSAVSGVVEPGPYVKLPFIQHVTKMDVQTHTLVATEAAPLSAASSDQQDVFIALAVNYRINPTAVTEVYTQYGSDVNLYYTKIVEPVIYESVKSVSAQYTAAEQLAKRAEMSQKIQALLESASQGKNYTFEKTNITNIAFSKAYGDSIERKAIAVQDAEASKNKLEQIKYEAQQTIEAARGVAESQRIQAQSLAAQGGSDYVTLKAIEKWNGQLPAQMIPGASTPILDLRKITN